jgi:hypothetical protein
MTLFCRIVVAKRILRFVFNVGCQLAAACQPFGAYNLFSNVDDELMVDQHFPTCLTHACHCPSLSAHPRPRKRGFYTISLHPKMSVQKKNLSTIGVDFILTIPY